MIGDGMSGQAPRYRWFLGALVDIAKTEGLRGLYTGVGANVGHASTLAAGEVLMPVAVAATLDRT